MLECQERYKFIESPEAYLEDLYGEERRRKLNGLPLRKWYEPKSSFYKKTSMLIADIEKNYNRKMKNIKKEAKEALSPAYVYYKGNKIEVPNDFYLDYKTADIPGYLNYLKEEDERKHVVTDEDREKARLLDCSLDYNYLQTLLDRMRNSPDLTITVKTKDGATIILRQNKQVENDLYTNEVLVDANTNLVR